MGDVRFSSRLYLTQIGFSHLGLMLLRIDLPACLTIEIVQTFKIIQNPYFSHVVIFWTDPANPKAADELVAGAEKYLRPIPGVLHFRISVARLATSARPVVDQTYQVALNLVFPSKQAQDEYQTHPMHVEFVEKVFKPRCKKVVVYDFE